MAGFELSAGNLAMESHENLATDAAVAPAVNPVASDAIDPPAESASAASPTEAAASVAAAPRPEPPHASLIPFVVLDRPARPRPEAKPGFLSFFAARSGVAAAAAAFAALGILSGVAIYDRGQQKYAFAAQVSENQSLAQSVKALRAKVEALEAAKPRDETADLRKSLAELKSGLASARDSNASIAQLGARLDKVDREHAARIDKLGERIDREAAARGADVVARIDKLEKKAAAPVVAALPAAAPAPVTLPKRPAVLATPPAVSKETTGSIERKLGKIPGWAVREVHDGVALVEGPDGVQETEPGDVLPGAGRVQRIERRGNAWYVVTSQGSFNSADQAF